MQGLKPATTSDATTVITPPAASVDVKSSRFPVALLSPGACSRISMLPAAIDWYPDPAPKARLLTFAVTEKRLVAAGLMYTSIGPTASHALMTRTATLPEVGTVLLSVKSTPLGVCEDVPTATNE